MDLDQFFIEEETNDGQNFDIKKYIKGIYKRKWLVIAVFLVVLIPWVLYVKSQPPQYEAFALIRFKNYESKNLRALNEGRITELRSRTFAERVVAQLGLTLEIIHPKNEKHPLQRDDIFYEFYTDKNPVSGNYKLVFDKKLKEYRLYYITLEKREKLISQGDFSKIVDSDLTLNGFTFRIKPSIVDKISVVNFAVKDFFSTVNSFRAHVSVDMNRAGTLMRLSIVDKNPYLVANMVNELADLFVQESVSSQRKRSKNYKDILEQKLMVSKENLDKANAELKAFKQTHYINLDNEVNSKIAEISSLQAKVSNLKETASSLSMLLAKLKSVDKNSNKLSYIYREIANNMAFKNDPSMGILKQQLLDLESKRAELIKQVNVTHPDVIKLDQQIQTIYSEIQTIAENRLNEIYREVNSLATSEKDIRQNLRVLPAEELRLAELTQNVKVANTIYSDLLAKYQEAQITESVETQDIDILDPAIPPQYPVNRDKKKKAAMGGFLALFLSLGTAITLEFMDKTIKTPEDVKKYLKLSVIGTIPNVKFDEEIELNDADKIKKIDSQLVTYDYSPTPVGEAYRALRTKIMFSKNTGRIKTLVVTSFAPGDGKSFTCSNLAITLAQHKTNVLLVDADLRRGVQHNTFSVAKEPGLTNYLMGVATFNEVTQETHVPNLYMVSCGSMVPNPSELLGSMRLKRFIDEAKRRFDFIMFDTPPLNAATDSVVLGTQVDGLLIIARAEVTNRNVAKQKLDLFENVPVNIIGAVLNGSEQDLAHEGYSYYHY
ncbi:MAG: polysaccharide biosynthesis tyrosine autokinase [Calditrichaeota bacterium]|nr:polysaccharide biosynthesis tyrosine autokinase [Calditrichota bacterium]